MLSSNGFCYFAALIEIMSMLARISGSSMLARISALIVGHGQAQGVYKRKLSVRDVSIDGAAASKLAQEPVNISQPVIITANGQKYLPVDKEATSMLTCPNCKKSEPAKHAKKNWKYEYWRSSQYYCSTECVIKHFETWG